MKDDKVVHVAEVIPTTQPFLDVMVHPVEINVGEKLGRKISYRDTYFLAGWLAGCKTGAVNVKGFQIGFDQPQGLWAGHFPLDQGQKNFTIDTRKIFSNITLQDVRIDPGELLKAINRRMASLAFSRGVGVVNEGRIEDRFQDVMKCMMDHTIPVRRGADKTLFRFVNGEMTIGSRFIGAFLKLLLKTPEFAFQMKI